MQQPFETQVKTYKAPRHYQFQPSPNLTAERNHSSSDSLQQEGRNDSR